MELKIMNNNYIGSMKKEHNEVNDKMFDDLIAFGICMSKTEIIDGKLSIKYIDPISDEMRKVLYNLEHKDSQIL